MKESQQITPKGPKDISDAENIKTDVKKVKKTETLFMRARKLFPFWGD